MLGTLWHMTLLAFVLADKGKAKNDEDEVLSSSLDSAGASVSPTSSEPPVATTPASALHFTTPSNATTCAPLMFQWQIIPPSSNVSDTNVRLFITNDGVVQSPPYEDVESLTRRQLPSTIISRDVTNNTSLAAGQFNWSAVTVPEGWYTLEASPMTPYPSDLATRSERFFVMAGSNTTCVSPNVSTSLAPSKTSLSAGALVGTVVGTVIGLAALLGAFLLPRLWRRGIPEHKAWKGKSSLYHVF